MKILLLVTVSMRMMNKIIVLWEENVMNEREIQTMLNVEILNRMNNKGAALVLKNILFNPDNNINYDEVYQLMMCFMPELKTYDGYKEENMQ